MKNNTKYSAVEIVKEAGGDPKAIGAMRVRIGGLPVNKPDQLIMVQPGVESLEVIIGNEKPAIVKFTAGTDERTVTEEAHKTLETREHPEHTHKTVKEE